jgi:hypothetical protein
MARPMIPRTEQRQSERNSANTAAVIRLENGDRTIPCLVSNLSEGGAKLVVGEPEQLPSEFILFLRPNSPVGRRCKVIWRIGDKIGVRFDSVADFSRPRHGARLGGQISG